MDITIAEAYFKGRIAGANHYFSLRRDSETQRPSSPHSEAYQLAGAEWHRGFIDGFDQGRHGGVRLRSHASDRRRAA